jgi:predicted Zn-dependent protease
MTFSKLLASTAFAAAFASSAFAAPAPAQVEEALRAQNWPAAEQLLRQVVAAMPNSAKAWHYLAQTEEKLGKHAEAREAQSRSERIDASLDFGSSTDSARCLQSIPGSSTYRLLMCFPYRG